MMRILALVAAVAVIGGCAGGSTTSSSGTPRATTTPPPVRPTDTPEVTASPEVTKPPLPTFEDIALAGKGKKVVKFEIPQESAAIAVMTHKGASNFIVHAIGADGESLAGLVNAIGDYSGTVLFDADSDQHTVAFEIDADGAWTITVKPVTAATAWDPTTPLNGTGDSVYRVSPASSGMVILDLTYQGKSNFIVHAYSADGREGLANEIGDFSGQVLLPDGTFLLEVVANGGTWTMKPG